MKRAKVIFCAWLLALILSACGLESGEDENSVLEFETEDETYFSSVSSEQTSAPQTYIKKSVKPANPTTSTDATFGFSCNQSLCTFKCKLDDGPWKKCQSPKTYAGLSDARRHTFKVKATNIFGITDPTPAKYSWTIDATAPETTITSNPPDPTNSSDAIFAFTCNEGSCTFECQLDGAGFSPCASPKAYSGLTDGAHTFKVRAKDLAGNVDPTPVSYSWTILTSVQVSAGWGHTCVTSSGAVKCWGDNYYGQLGDGTNNTSNVPVNVSGLSSGASEISAGGWHTCALTDSGAVKCWGDNGDGQLGDGTTTNRNVPIAVSGLSSGIIAIAGGGDHTCALASSGAVKCWGDNEYGQLGDGTTVNRNVPVNVSGLSSGIIAIAGGGAHTCALASSGAVKCWGDNEYGQLGDGTNNDSNISVNVSGLSSGIIAIAAGGEHTCALTSSGALKCWGANGDGQLGNGRSNVPVDVSGLSSGIIAISAGGVHTCALTYSGAVKCWGFNWYGQLGDGTGGYWRNDSNVPVAVSGLSSGISAISAGWYHTCALTDSGAVGCWGRNNYGQLGDWTYGGLSNVPVAVSYLSSGISAISAGKGHTCALTSSGAVKCWGYNWHGQLGDGTYNLYSYVPVNVLGFGP